MLGKSSVRITLQPGGQLKFPTPKVLCPVQCGGVLDGTPVLCVLGPSGFDNNVNVQQFEARKCFIVRECAVDPPFLQNRPVLCSLDV